MPRRPPTPTLFPYTTLFRSELAGMAVVERGQRGSDPLKDKLQAPQSMFLLEGELLLAFEGGGTLVLVGGSEETRQAINRQKRSEEHTSELQSLAYLVCRLLL